MEQQSFGQSMFPAAAIRNHRPDGFKQNKRSITVLEARSLKSKCWQAAAILQRLSGRVLACLSQLLELLAFLAVTSVLQYLLL